MTADTLSLPGRCLSTAEAAAYLGIATDTLHQWRARGQGPAYVCVGARRVYRLDDLRQWADERRVVPGQGTPVG